MEPWQEPGRAAAGVLVALHMHGKANPAVQWKQCNLESVPRDSCVSRLEKGRSAEKTLGEIIQGERDETVP
jgi:hypothetical protein